MGARKKTFLSVFVMLVLTMCLMGQTPVAKAGDGIIAGNYEEPFGDPVDPSGGSTITGQVLDQNGQGIGGVLVLSDNGARNYSGIRTTTSNSDGSYTLQDVQSGLNHLQAKIDGLSLAHYWGFTIVEGQTYTNINFSVRPGGGSISGRVIDIGGNGISDATINVWEQTAHGFDNGAWVFTKTDASGYFKTRLIDAPGPGLPTGIYTVKANKDGLPDTTVANMHVTAGSVTSDVVLVIVSGTGVITGQTIDSTGAPVSNAEVFVDNGVVQVSGQTDASGFYQIINLPSGSYNVVVSKVGYATAHRPDVNVISGSTTSGMNFTLMTSFGHISGRVVDVNGQPIVGAMLLADSNQGTGFATSTTDSNGEYILINLAPMDYFVHASAAGLSGVVLIATVEGGIFTTGVDFALGADAGGISGRITKDGLPAPYAAIYVNSSSGSSQMFYSNSIADSNGNYVINNIPPGEYDVHISSVPGYTNQIRYQVQVAKNIVTGVDFNLRNGSGSVEGYITNVEGKSVEGATVEIFQLTNPGVWASTTTDSEGHYIIRGLWEGFYNFYTQQSQFPTVMKSNVFIPVSEPAQIDIILGQDRSLVVNPRIISVYLDEQHEMQELVKIDVSSGDPTTWEAQSPAEWLLLSGADDTYEDSGLTGLDGLLLRFDPTKVEKGLHSTELILTAPDAAEVRISVSMSVGTNLIFLPLVGALK